jgi:WD40 repeat protein
MAWTQWRVGGSVVDLKWSPDGQKLAALTREGLFVLTAEGAPAWSVKRRFSTRNTAAWSPDGTRLAAAERGIRVWTADGEEVTTLGGGSEVIVAWLDDLWIVAGTLGMAYDTRRTMRPWNVDTGEAGWTVRLDDADGSVEGLAVTPDGMHVVAGGNDDGSWTVLNAQDGTQAHQSWSHSPSIVQFSPDGSRMVCAVGREVSVGTSAEPPFATFRLTGSAEVEGLALAPDGRALAVAGGGRVSIRDAESRVEQHGLEVAATRLAWSPDGRLLAAATADGVQAFDAAGWCGTLQEPVARPPSGVVPF